MLFLRNLWFWFFDFNYFMIFRLQLLVVVHYRAAAVSLRTQHNTRSRCCLHKAQSRSSAAFRLFQVIFWSFDVMIMKWAGNVNSDDAVRLFDASACTYTNADTRPRLGSWKYLQWKCGCAGKNNKTKSEPLFPGRSPVFDHTKANRIYPEEQSNLKIDW